MIIVIKNVNKIKGRCYGVTKYVSKQKAVIELSLELNKDLAEYSSTLLHELLHVWIAILQANDAKLNKKKEHTFIYKAEREIAKLMTVLRRK